MKNLTVTRFVLQQQTAKTVRLLLAMCLDRVDQGHEALVTNDVQVFSTLKFVKKNS